MSQLSAVISTLIRLQNVHLPYEVNLDLIDTLKLAFDVFYSEDEIFELSLAREPRANGTSATTVRSYHREVVHEPELCFNYR